MRLQRFPRPLPFVLLAFAAGCGQTSSEDPSSADSQLFADVQNETVSEQLDTFQNRGQWIDHYAKFPTDCVAKVDELDGTKTLFHGCYDWHSSVHAHWAVLRADLTGAGGSAEGAEKMDQRLTADALAKVKSELEANSAYEMPYGRAWLLRLASEHEIWSVKKGKADANRMRALADFTAKSLLDYYTATPPNPRSADYDNHPWAIAQMTFWFRFTKDDANLAKVNAWIQDKFVKNPVTWAETNDSDPSAFFSKYWSWSYAVSEMLDSQAAIDVIKPESIPDAALTPVPDPAGTDQVHHIGINWSRSWAIKSLAAQVIAVKGAGDAQAKRLVKSYHEHVQAGRKRHEKYKGNYYAYDHWVPQFGIYAITD